jgi:hypothetical protein
MSIRFGVIKSERNAKMNITVKDFNEQIVSRIAGNGFSSDQLQTIRLSLLFANDGQGHRVDLAKLATFSDFDFWHDVIGIDHHASRQHDTCGQLGLFVPRCGFVKEVAKERIEGGATWNT